MGLFDKKTKKHDGIETGPVKKTEESPTADDVEQHTSQPVAIPQSRPTAVPTHAPAERQLEMEHPDYGINKAIELMRMLPDDNMELIVCVVKTTLESTNVKVNTIINDATRKQGVIEGRIEVLAREIAGLEAEVAVRKREIALLEADYKETSTVKDWLMVADTLASPAKQNGAAGASSVASATVPHPSLSVGVDDKK